MKRTALRNREKVESKKQKNKNTLLFTLLIILGFIGIALIMFYVNSSTSMKVNEDLYQYFFDAPVTYEKGTSFSSEYMEAIGNNDHKDIEKTPFYSINEKKIYLPRNYAWKSISDYSYYRIPEFSSIINNGSSTFQCSVERKDYTLINGFLFDDSGNYIFLDSGIVYVGETGYSVSPLSFFSRDYEVIRVYDYENNEFHFINTNMNNPTYESNVGYKVELAKGLYQDIFGDQSLLAASPATALSITERSE